MSNLPSAVLVVVLAGALLAIAIALAEPLVVRVVASMEPRQRARWIFGVLTAPLLFGGAVLALAIGHCVVPRLLGLPDDCDGVRGEGCAFCFFQEGRPGALGWALALACALPLAAALARLAVGVGRARRARRRLECVARPRGDGVYEVPGAGAYTIGWPSPSVFVGEELSRALTPEGVAAVMAHEREHLRRGDGLLRALARALSVLHLPRVRARLIEALDVAVEQACDAHAGVAVADPLIVAQALVDTARLRVADPSGLGCVGASLPARISSLCEPPGAPGPDRVGATAALALALGACALAFDHEVHRAAELVSLLISR